MDEYQVERRAMKNRVRRRGIYLLPNLFTTAALFAGFYAIVQAMNNNFDQSAVAIFVAMVLDGLDGRVARMTRTQSAFGAEYDSLADMVSFGAAPALVIYEWVLRDMGKLGWIAAFVYVAGAALRLARFNTLLEVADKRWFQGLPSPSAAAVVVHVHGASRERGTEVRDDRRDRRRFVAARHEHRNAGRRRQPASAARERRARSISQPDTI